MQIAEEIVDLREKHEDGEEREVRPPPNVAVGDQPILLLNDTGSEET